MLDLEPGVNLQKGDGSVARNEKLAGASTDITNLLENRLGGLVELALLLLGEKWRGSLFN